MKIGKKGEPHKIITPFFKTLAKTFGAAGMLYNIGKKHKFR
jgi:hypothetical protein